MKILFAIPLSLLVFFQSLGVGISDILALNELVDHANFHSEEYGDDSFSFFEKHYGSLKAEHQESNQEEKPQHEKLPFQHNYSNHSVCDVVKIKLGFSLERPLFTLTSNPHFYYKNLYSYLEKPSVFQPPRLS